MPFPIIPMVVAGGLALLFAAADRSGGKRLKLSDYLNKLRNSHSAGPPTVYNPPSAILYVFGDGILSTPLNSYTQPYAVAPNAVAAMIQSIESGYSIWADISILGETYFLAFAPRGTKPSDPQDPKHEWILLADKSDLPSLKGYQPPPPSGTTPPQGVSAAPFVPGTQPPTNGVLIPVPGSLPAIAAAPAPASDGKPRTGIADLDTLIRSGNASPAQLHAAAAALREAGKADRAQELDDYADSLYASLRAAHAAVGGTPFQIREGDIPDHLAKYYGGSLDELARANPGTDIYRGNTSNGWRVGKIVLLPIRWNAESKLVPPPLKARPLAKAKPSVVYMPRGVDVIPDPTGKGDGPYPPSIAV